MTTGTPTLGRGAARSSIRVERVGGRSRVTRSRVRTPLRLLTPDLHNDAAHLITSTYGGGLVQGDQLTLKLHVAAGATAVLGTQSSNKVYRSPRALTGQRLVAHVDEGATLIALPDPLTCFTAARFTQRQSYLLGADASLLMFDGYTSGRWANGERWAFESLRSNIDVRVGRRAESKLVFRDRVQLDAAAGPMTADARMGRFNAVGTLVLLGPRMVSAAEQWLTAVHSEPVPRRASMYVTASPLREGAVLRIAAVETEMMLRYIRQQLQQLLPIASAWLGRRW